MPHKKPATAFERDAREAERDTAQRRFFRDAGPVPPHRDDGDGEMIEESFGAFEERPSEEPGTFSNKVRVDRAMQSGAERENLGDECIMDKWGTHSPSKGERGL